MRDLDRRQFNAAVCAASALTLAIVVVIATFQAHVHVLSDLVK